MLRTFLIKIWNTSPKVLAEYLFPHFFMNRENLAPFLPFDVDSKEVRRLKSLPRYVNTTTQFMGRPLEIVDVDSYFGMCEEIFLRKNYEFEAGRKAPLIIDCGANIGLSVIFFKTLYPQCTIIAFEPDRTVFPVLKRNIETFGFQDIELQNKAVWTSETELDFHAEGSWGGRIRKPGDVKNIIRVPTSRLRDYLDRRVDFLKIDVEGAETDILKDCADRMEVVEHLFVEYHSHFKEQQTLHEILAILHAAGFRYHMKEASPRNVPFVNRRLEGMDSQLDIFAYRI